jgi:hypothetical protein
MQVHDRLVELTRCIPGAKVENNKFCVSVHFRRVDEKVKWPLLSLPFYSSLSSFFCRLHQTNPNLIKLIFHSIAPSSSLVANQPTRL